MDSMRRRMGLFFASAIAAAGLWACSATRNSDGSWDITFAPDMTITAYGLEDALGKLTDLLTGCLNGTFPRTCTADELDQIDEAMERVLKRKEKLGEGRPPRPSGTVVR